MVAVQTFGFAPNRNFLIRKYLREPPPALGPPRKDTVAAHCAPDGAPPVLASHCVVCKRFVAHLVEHERGGGGLLGEGLQGGVTSLTVQNYSKQ